MGDVVSGEIINMLSYLKIGQKGEIKKVPKIEL